MSARRIFSNSVLLLSAEVIERILRLVLVIFAARLLGDEDYGKFTFALAFTSLFLIIADGGLHQLMTREIARNQKEAQKYFANAFFVKFFYAILMALLMYGSARLTGKPEKVLMAVYVMGAAQIIGSFSDFFASVFRAFQRMLYDVIATLIFGILIASVGIAILVQGYDYLTLTWVYFGAQVVRLIYCVTTLRLRFLPIRIQFDAPTVKFLIREAFPFGVLYFFALMYTYIDSTMLSLMVGDEAVGWYNAAYRFIFAMVFIPVALMKAVFPALSQYYKESQENFNRLFERSFKIM